MKQPIDSIGGGMILTDAAGRIQFLNHAAEAMLGYKTEELQRRRIDIEIRLHARLAPSEAEGEVSPVLQALERGRNLERVDAALRSKSGQTIPVCASVYLLTSEGQWVGAVELFRDLRDIPVPSEAEGNAQERRQQLAALEAMAGEVAHAIYNPLGGLKGFASMLARKIQTHPDRRYVNHVIEAVESIEQVVNNFLLYAKPMALNLSKISAPRFFDACLSQVSGVRIETRYDANIAELTVDAPQMRHALLNLVFAMEQTVPAEGTLCIETALLDEESLSRAAPKRRQRLMRIIIANEGVKDNLKTAESQLFDPFCTNQKIGTGFGLAVAHRIIEAHCGKMRLMLGDARVVAFIIELPVESRPPYEGGP
jgi:PAS domain S-box-containing protein